MVKRIIVLLSIMAGILCGATFAISQSDKGVVKEVSPVAGQERPQASGSTATSDKTKKQTLDNADDLYTQVELFSYALTTLQAEYVEEKKPKDIIYGALTGMLGSLDPHSQFLSPEDFEELKTETEGKFGGLGIEISIRDGLLTVVTPIEDTPAWKAGIKAGDRIVKIEKDLTRDMTLNQAVKKLRGDPGTKIHITVLRESESRIQDFEITREIIRVQDVKEPRILEEGIAYVRLVEFRENSRDQLYKELTRLKGEGATALILDVRNNPGGLLNVAIKVCEMFLPEGKTIVSTKGRHPAQDSVSVSHNTKNEFADWPIVILINEGSASGSEILAGALKDNKRAVTLGVKSFGKGSVQSVIPLPDGSGLRLTTAKYFTPSGVCIHEIGITPDIVIERVRNSDDAEDEENAQEFVETGKKPVSKKDLSEAKKVFEEMALQGITDPNEIAKRKKEDEIKKRMAKDNQVQSAISVIKGIRVYKKLQPDDMENAPAKK